MRDQTRAHGSRVSAEAHSPAGWVDMADAFAPAGFGGRGAGVCIHRRGKVLYLGRSMSSLLGLDGSEAALGAEVLELVSPADRARVGDAMSRAARAGRSEPTTATFRAPDGTSTTVELIALSFGWVGPPVEALYARALGGGSRKEDRVYMERREGENRTRESPRVLICDDEARLGQLTAGLLTDFGFRPVTVGTGEEAIEELTRAGGGADVVLLDVNLVRGRSAKEVLREMLALGTVARVILTSGLAEEDLDPDLTIHPLVAGYVAKPYAVEALVAAIRAALVRPPT